MSDNTIYHLWLREATTPSRARKLLKTYGNAEKIYNLTDYSEASYIKNNALDRLLNKNISSAKKLFDKCNDMGIHILTPDSNAYPPNLLSIPDYPTVLFGKGLIPDWKNLFTVAIVGTRNLSQKGISTTSKLCEGLVASGATVVSGFAEGADTIAAETAISQNSFTVAVLGCGVDVIYPKSNAVLYNKILKNGLFLSEYPPHTKPIYYNFPQRNRIIAGISRAVIVTQAPQKSGSVITGNYAIKYGIDLFAIPEANSGTDYLIDAGAFAVNSADDITKHYDALPQAYIEKLSVSTDPITELLTDNDLSIDEICAKLNMSITECNSRCFMLELEGKIRKLPGGFYHKI